MKSIEPDANLGQHACKPESVRQATEDVGRAKKCILQQVGSNGNPKHRDASEWGIGAKSIADENALK